MGGRPDDSVERKDQVATDLGEGATMTRVTILREDAGPEEATYRAVGGSAQAAGRTAGEAIDALAARLPADAGETLLIVRDLRPDRFFPEDRRRRLEALMGLLHAARDRGEGLPAGELDELQGLVDAEVEATARRSEEAWRELPR